ncbi:MAG: DNA mismatch repair protein MutS, partial [Bacteroidaceae bacterium]|nr:DNA mismatch repair protein MutS [Bacteroidaceae bacterium]
MAKEELTPMMKQFHDLKAKHPDAILLFRCGDFYETYCSDAVTASQVLGITLTRRNNKGSQAATEMAGFPYHALDTYLPRLVRAGFRVAICDQLEDPKLAKKLVKRGITELVTPGVAISDNVLNSRENNFLCAVHFGKASLGISLLDISTGEFLVAEGAPEYIDKLLVGFSPKEILVESGMKSRLNGLFGNKYFVFKLEDWAFSENTSKEKLLKQFEVKSLKGFGVDHLKDACVAAGAVLCYLELTHHHNTGHITSIRRIEEDRFVRLDKFTVRNLELVAPMNEGGQSLLSVLDRTLTPMGARMLRRWLLFPLRNVAAIQRRQDGVEHFFRNPDFRDICQEELARVGDMERILSKVAVGRANPRDMQQLRIALEGVEVLKNACLEAEQENIRRLGEEMVYCRELKERILRTLRPDPPVMLNKGGVIASGVNPQLDELRSISSSGKDYLLQIQQRESELTGIPSLKIGFNNVFGYYIEVRNTYKENVPAEWVRKQTLAQAERYITQELKEYEEKILGAEDRILALETQIFNDLLQDAATYITDLQRNAAALSQLDCLHSLAA